MLKENHKSSNNIGIIEIEGMEFFSYHGHYEEEQIIGNRFLIDLRIETDCLAAAKSDRIEDAVNYQTAYKIVKQAMKTNSYLLENVAYRILNELYDQLYGVINVTVKVSKMNPPMGGKIEKVSITMSK